MLPNTEKNGGRNISELTLDFQVYILLLNEQNQQRGGRGGREGAQNKHRKERDWGSFSEEGGRGRWGES